MARFIFKINNAETTLDGVPAGPVKDSFVDLKTKIENHLGSQKCGTHRQEVSVILESDEKKTRLTGMGGCCREFVKQMSDRLKSLEGIVGPDAEWSTRTMHYLEKNKTV